MSQFEKLLVVVAVALAAVIAVLVFATSKEPKPAPVDTEANIGKCLQAQRVLYRVDRGQAAEACLAQLDASGPDRFDRTWRNYDTEVGSW